MTTECGHLKALRRREAAARLALQKKQAFIADLQAEIESHVCESKRKARPVPDIEMVSIGPFDYREFFESIYGDKGGEAVPNYAFLAPESERALERLEPLCRFVLEARMRGASLTRITELVGWKSTESVRYYESKALRRLRHPYTCPELLAGYKKLMAAYDLAVNARFSSVPGTAKVAGHSSAGDSFAGISFGGDR